MNEENYTPGQILYEQSCEELEKLFSSIISELYDSSPWAIKTAIDLFKEAQKMMKYFECVHKEGKEND